MPPIVFPWELFDESGDLITEQEFIFVKGISDDFESRFGREFFRVYQEIWKAARKAVQAASRISFVGLSMHPYMEPGLKWLFEGKTGQVRVTIANTTDDMDHLSTNHTELLIRVAPEMMGVGSWQCPTVKSRRGETGETYLGCGLTQRKSFKEFIEKDMSWNEAGYKNKARFPVLCDYKSNSTAPCCATILPG